MNQKTIPNTLKEHRQNTSLTQMQVAKKLGFTTAERISAWEKGLSFPHLKNVLKLSALYKTLPTDLYGELFDQVQNEIESTI